MGGPSSFGVQGGLAGREGLLLRKATIVDANRVDVERLFQFRGLHVFVVDGDHAGGQSLVYNVHRDLHDQHEGDTGRVVVP